MVGIPSAINAAQEIADEISPAPVRFKRTSSAKALKARLDWGKPDLTIIDVRDRDSFNGEHITGAVPIPLDKLVETVQPMLEQSRDIYVYGDSAEQTINAAAQLDRVGFDRVAVIDQGLTAWKQIQGPTEGRNA